MQQTATYKIMQKIQTDTKFRLTVKNSLIYILIFTEDSCIESLSNKKRRKSKRRSQLTSRGCQLTNIIYRWDLGFNWIPIRWRPNSVVKSQFVELSTSLFETSMMM